MIASIIKAEVFVVCKMKLKGEANDTKRGLDNSHYDHCKSELYCFVMQNDSNCWFVCQMLSCIILPKSFTRNVGIPRSCHEFLRSLKTCKLVSLQKLEISQHFWKGLIDINASGNHSKFLRILNNSKTKKLGYLRKMDILQNAWEWLFLIWWD